MREERERREDTTHWAVSEAVQPHSMNWTLSDVLFTVQARLRLGSNCLQLSKSLFVGRPGSTVGVGVGGVESC